MQGAGPDHHGSEDGEHDFPNPNGLPCLLGKGKANKISLQEVQREVDLQAKGGLGIVGPPGSSEQ